MLAFDYVVMSTALASTLYDYDGQELAESVSVVIDAVRRRGDDAVRGGAGRSGADLSLPLALQPDEVKFCLEAIPAAVLEDMRLVQGRTRRFAEAQRAAITDFETEVSTGVRVGVRRVPVSSVGICLPNRATDGLALSAVQAAAITAQAAGVERVVACVPAGADEPPPPLLIAALSTAGLTEIYRAAGVHGFAALSFGTESIPRVERVFGLGDPALNEAERRIPAARDGDVGLGILIIADDHSDPELIAADLIAAGECGETARGVLITTSPALAATVASTVERQLKALPGGQGARRAWERRDSIHVVDDREAACALADRHALHCVEVMAVEPRWYLGRLHRCTELFLGAGAGIALAEDVFARAGAQTPAGELEQLWVGAFLHTITYRESEEHGAADSAALARHCRVAGLEARARAYELRAAIASSPSAGLS
jgi:sulfopropanediol 3-dehydrogenase